MRTIRTTMAAGVAAILLAGLTGCGNKVAKEVAAMNDSNIKRLSNIYEAHQNYKGGQGPKDEAEFKAFIKEFDPHKLKMMSIDPDNLDPLFTSERDGKPFRIRYKVGGGRGAVAAVVFEQEGKNGKKQVGFTGRRGEIEEHDEATYAQLLTGKGGTSGRPTGRPTGAPTGPGK